MDVASPLAWVLLGAVAFCAATLAAVSGFGGAALLLPVVAAVFGVRDAVPILTVAQLIGNGSRVWFNRRELDRHVVGWFAVGAVPLALLGGVLFALAPLHALTRTLGVFLILIVVWRRLRPQPSRAYPVQRFAWIGAGSSLLSALLGSVGPLVAPFFLAYGLVKGAYIGTEACCAVVMHLCKLIAYRQMDVLTGQSTLIGLALGPVMIAGSYAGQHIVNRLPKSVFVLIVELAMLAAGLLFVIRG
jgi:hypothetical protein